MLSWWGMAVLATIFAAWLHWESGIWQPSKQFASLTMADTGAMVYLALAVYDRRLLGGGVNPPSTQHLFADEKVLGRLETL